MVIINNRYEYLSILKAPGVRMQTPVVSNNNSSTTTLTRDSLVQSQQQQQQNQQLNNNNNNNSLLNNNSINLNNNNNNGNGVSLSNNNNNNNNNGLPGLAKAVLICRQNSHPFNVSIFYLPNLPYHCILRCSFIFRIEHSFLSPIKRLKSGDPLRGTASPRTMQFSTVRSYLETMPCYGTAMANSTSRLIVRPLPK